MTDFFRINMPYGLQRNDKGEWMAFNRDEMPIGISKKTIEYDQHSNFEDLPVFTSYPRMPENFLMRLAADEESIQKDDDGKINKIFLYKHGPNSFGDFNAAQDHFEEYWKKLKLLTTVGFEYPQQTQAGPDLQSGPIINWDLQSPNV